MTDEATDYTDGEKDYTDRRKGYTHRERIIGCCYRVHTALDPAFGEKIYHNALRLSFEEEGLKHQTEKEFEVVYINKRVAKFRVDLVVEDEVIVEIEYLAGNIQLCFTHSFFLS